MNSEVRKEYFRLRSMGRGGIVGESAKWALADARTIVEVNRLEAEGLVRLTAEGELESYSDCGTWRLSDSIGMCIYSDPTSPYENDYVPDLMRSAIKALANA